MSQDILSQLQAAHSDEEREWLLLQMVLATLDPVVQQAAQVAAIPHWFDLPFLEALLDEADLAAFREQAGFEALTALSFVELFPGRGYNVHERSRTLLLDRLWQENKKLYRTLSERVVDYCAKQNLDDPSWRIEWIFHLLIAEPEEGATQLQNQGLTWQNPPNFAYDLVDAMVQVAREHANASRLSQRGMGWTLFWEAHLDKIYDRSKTALERLSDIVTNADDDPYLAANTIEALGDVHVRLSEYELARARYEAALPIYQAIGARLGEANTILNLGYVSHDQDDYENARNLFETARQLYQKIGTQLGQFNVIFALGDLDRSEKRWEDAKNRYQQALTFYQQIGMVSNIALALQRLGHTEKGTGNIEQARQYYEQALKLFNEIGSPSAAGVQANLDALAEKE